MAEFKTTEIGDIPAEWEVELLNDLVENDVIQIKNGFPFGGFNQEGYGIPHLRPFNIATDGRVELSSIKYIETDRDLEAHFLQPGDVFFNNTNSEELVGKTAYWNKSGQFVYSNHMTSIRVLDRQILDSQFLASYFYRRWQEGYFQRLCRRHVNQASITLARMKQIAIPLPPLDEQRQIAYVLNTVQQAIAAQDDLIAAAQELKRSLMRRLFTYGPGPEPAPTKETDIGEVPEHWEVGRLGDLVDIKSGGTPSRHKPEYWGGHIPWVTTGEVNYSVITFAEEKITEAGLKNSSARLVPAGTLLLAMYGQGVTRGKVAVLGIDAAINQACAAFFPHNNIKTGFLFHYLSFQYERIRNLGHGAHQKNLSATLIKSIELPIPPESEQRLIAHILQTSDAKIAAEQDRKAALQELFNSLLQELMTGRLRV